MLGKSENPYVCVRSLSDVVQDLVLLSNLRILVETHGLIQKIHVGSKNKNPTSRTDFAKYKFMTFIYGIRDGEAY
jgi:G:T-mismatch repair DNA endonuclease (very short patch repair protein)